MSLSCFDDKIYIQNNVYDGLAVGYPCYLNNCLKKLFLSSILF